MTDFKSITPPTETPKDKEENQETMSASVKESFKTLGGNVKDMATEVKTAGLEAKDHLLEDVSTAAKQQSQGFVNELKSQVATQVNHFARTFDKTKHQLEGEDLNHLGQYSGQLSQTFKGVATYLEDKDISDMTHDLAALGRRQPAFFIAGAFLLGLASSRFLSSTAPQK